MFDLLFRGRRVVFDSPLSFDELTRRLQRDVAAPTWPRMASGPHRFEGTVAGDRFRMMRRVGGRNSFRPVIEGQLSPAPVGVRVTVRLTMHPAVLAFGAVLLAVAGPIATIALGEWSVTSRWAALAPVAVLAVVLAGFAAIAGAEARTSTRLLADVFETEPVLV